MYISSFYGVTKQLKQQETHEKQDKSKKTEEWCKSQKRVTLAKKRDMFSQVREHVLRRKKNVSRWQKRDTFCETLIWLLATEGENVTRFT